jgi:hypothetical protein
VGKLVGHSLKAVPFWLAANSKTTAGIDLSAEASADAKQLKVRVL